MNKDAINETKDKLEEEQIELESTEEPTVNSEEIDNSQEEVAKEISLEEKLEQKEKESMDYFDRLQRTMAEFDNFRKRTVKEKNTMYENGVKEVLEKLLPVIDNFERAIGSAEEDKKDEPFVQGVEMIYKQLMTMLKEVGVEEIETVGKEFDPNLHHAVTHEENEDYGDNEIVEVFQKGYIYKETVLRYSMVKVAN